MLFYDLDITFNTFCTSITLCQKMSATKKLKMSTSDSNRNNSPLFFRCLENIEKRNELKKLEELRQMDTNNHRAALDKQELELAKREKNFNKKVVIEKAELYELVSWL